MAKALLNLLTCNSFIRFYRRFGGLIMNALTNGQYRYDHQQPSEAPPAISEDVEDAFHRKHGQIMTMVEHVIEDLFHREKISGGAYGELIDKHGDVNTAIDDMTIIFLDSVKEFITKTANENPFEHIDEPEECEDW